MNKLYKCLIIVLCLCGCTNNTVDQLPTLHPTSTLYPLRTFTPTAPTNTPTATPTPTPVPGLIFSLPQGEYLVSGEYLSGTNNWSIGFHSPDGVLIETFPSNPNSYYVSELSPNMSYFLDYPTIFDLTTGETWLIDSDYRCYANVVWSPDSLYVALPCTKKPEQFQVILYSVLDRSIASVIDVSTVVPVSWLPDSSSFIISGTSDGTVEENLYVYSLEKKTLVQITNLDNGYLCDSAIWSPDGNWIAHYFGRAASGIVENTGLHILNTDCLTLPSTCLVNGLGIEAIPPYSWSPDSQFIAGITGDGYEAVGMYRVKNGQTLLVQTYDLSAYVSEEAISPSGKWIAAGTENGVYSIDIGSGAITLIENADQFYSWVSVP